MVVVGDGRTILRKLSFVGDLKCLAVISRQQGETPLHAGSWNGHADVVRVLLASGANINATNTLVRAEKVLMCVVLWLLW